MGRFDKIENDVRGTVGKAAQWGNVYGKAIVGLLTEIRDGVTKEGAEVGKMTYFANTDISQPVNTVPQFWFEIPVGEEYEVTHFAATYPSLTVQAAGAVFITWNNRVVVPLLGIPGRSTPEFRIPSGTVGYLSNDAVNSISIVAQITRYKQDPREPLNHDWFGSVDSGFQTQRDSRAQPLVGGEHFDPTRNDNQSPNSADARVQRDLDNASGVGWTMD